MIFGRRFPPPFVPRRPQAAESKPQPPLMGGAVGRSPQGGHQTPRRPGGIVPLSPGVGKGAGPGGLWPPERRPGPAQREPRAGPRQGAAPTPPPGRWGGPRRGRSGKAQAGHGRRPGRQPHAQAAAASGRATAPRQSAPAGGLRPPAPRRPATRPDAGRPRAGGPAASHQPTPTAARAHGPGPDKAGPLRLGRGRPGRASTGPACTRPAAYLAGPARHLWGRAGHRHGGGPGRRALQRPRQRAGRGAPGRPHTEQGPSLPVVGRRRRQKNAGKLAPRLDSDWTKKNAGRTLCPPRLPLQRIPDIPLFGVVVRNVLDAGQFHMLL